jgi:ABC-2 type transport system permease protein
MWSICKKEWQQFFSNLSGYIAIILFLLVNGLFLFVLRDSNIFDYGYATLDRFFELAPWVLMFLVPAITMRAFSDEFRTGTFELLQTRPLSRWDIVGGKYFATLLVLLVVIIPTLVYVLTLRQLSATGTIDAAGIAGSYIGLFFLAAVFAAIGICCSSLTANAVIAFLVAVFICLIAYFGFGALGRLPLFQGGADYYLDMLGISFHYQSMSRGLLDSRDVIYFLSLIVLGLFITVRTLQKR